MIVFRKLPIVDDSEVYRELTAVLMNPWQVGSTADNGKQAIDDIPDLVVVI